MAADSYPYYTSGSPQLQDISKNLIGAWLLLLPGINYVGGQRKWEDPIAVGAWVPQNNAFSSWDFHKDGCVLPTDQIPTIAAGIVLPQSEAMVVNDIETKRWVSSGEIRELYFKLALLLEYSPVTDRKMLAIPMQLSVGGYASPSWRAGGVIEQYGRMMHFMPPPTYNLSVIA